MSTTRSWPRSPRSPSCGTAIKLEPRPDSRTHTPEPERSISKTVGETHTTYRIRLPQAEAAKFDAAVQSHRDGLIADWKRDHADGTRRRRRRPTDAPRTRPGRPRRSRRRRRVHEPGRGRVGHRGGAPPARAAHHRGRARGRRSARRRPASGSAALRRRPPLSDCATRTARRGSNATARSSGPDGPPAPSAAGCAARWSTATAAAWSPAAGRPAGCTPTTCGTGRTAAPPNWTTWCCCARSTTACTTAGASPSPAPPITSSSPTPTANHSSSGITGPPPDDTATGGPTVPRPDRGTRRLVVVPPVPTPATTNDN